MRGRGQPSEGFCAGCGGIAGTQIALAGRQTSVCKWGREHELRPRGPGGRASRAPQPGLSVSKHPSPLFLPLSSPRQTQSHMPAAQCLCPRPTGHMEGQSESVSLKRVCAWGARQVCLGSFSGPH